MWTIAVARPDGLEGPLDQFGAALGQHLDADVVRDGAVRR